jgi:hypothetical protein
MRASQEQGYLLSCGVLVIAVLSNISLHRAWHASHLLTGRLISFVWLPMD